VGIFIGRGGANLQRGPILFLNAKKERRTNESRGDSTLAPDATGLLYMEFKVYCLPFLRSSSLQFVVNKLYHCLYIPRLGN